MDVLRTPDAPVALLLHGQPTWSYLYRKVGPVLVARGVRVVAPDNIGFGRSDKPARPTDYTFARHIEWTRSLVTGLDLRDITLVAQDWGGPIGFSVLEEALVDYLLHTQRAPELRASDFVAAATAVPLPPEVLAAYDAPFPTPELTAGLRQMTALLPLTRGDVGARIGRGTMRALEQFERPFVTCYSDGDPATRGWETVFQERRGRQGEVTSVSSGSSSPSPLSAASRRRSWAWTWAEASA